MRIKKTQRQKQLATADNYQAVTAEDVMRVAKKYFDKKNKNVVVLVPEMPGE